MNEKMNLEYESACAEYEKKNYLVAYEKFYTLAVEHDVSCQMNVANMLLHGIGTAKDEEKAYEWYKQAAYNDDKQAQYIYAWHCLQNLEDEEGIKYIELSAASGYADALHDLAGFYVHGNYTCAADNSKAMDLYERAVILGKKEAMNGLFFTKVKANGKVSAIFYFIKNIFKFAGAIKNPQK